MGHFVQQHHHGGEVNNYGGGVHNEHDILSYAYDGHHAHILEVQGDEVGELNTLSEYQHHELPHRHEPEDQHDDAIDLAGR